MTLNIQLKEEDFLVHQLFSVSQKESTRKKKVRNWLFFSIGSATLSFFAFKTGTPITGTYLGIVSIASIFFYPKYFNWFHKRHFKKYVQENLKSRFGDNTVVKFNKETIETKDKTGESKININEVEEVQETSAHFFIKISSGAHLILPKNNIEDEDKLKEELMEIGLKISDHKNWTW